MEPQSGMPASGQPANFGNTGTTVTLPPQPVRVVVEQPTSGWSKFGRRLLWVVLGISILANLNMAAMYQRYFQDGSEIQERYHSLSRSAENKLAIIEIDGTIMSGDGFVKRQIDRVRDDDNVKAVVVRVDSPGGTVTGSNYIYHHLKKLREEKKIPVVVSMGAIAASGGYYVSMAAGDGEKLIYAEPTTWTGSIGVIIPHYDVSGLLERFDVTDDSISSHPFKQMGSPTRKLSPEEREKERALLQTLVDESFSGFKKIVLDNRAALRNDAALQDVVFTGQIFTAPQAQKNGLVDELGYMEDAIDRAISLAGLSKDNVRAVRFRQPLGALSALLGDSAKAPRMGLNLEQLLDLTAPRAFYLCTWLPAVVGTRVAE